MRLKRHKENDRAAVWVTAWFPLIAKDWLAGCNIGGQESEKGIEVAFSTLEMANFYARRWNGQQGQMFVWMQQGEAVSA